MPEKHAFADVETALRERAMTYPQSTEDFPWGHRAIKVKGKLFLILGEEKGSFRITMKLPDAGAYALTHSFAKPTDYGLGKHGWVTCSFQPGDTVPLDLLEEWLDESYRAVAPKKLILALNAQRAGANEVVIVVPKKAKSKPAKSKKKK
jgi:predicted DNA-binding protein (MmcQ/YjbR family)